MLWGSHPQTPGALTPFPSPPVGVSPDTQSDSRPDTYGAPKVIRIGG